jgi:hypothetical protein
MRLLLRWARILSAAFAVMERLRLAGMGELTTSGVPSGTVESSMEPAASSCMLFETAAVRGIRADAQGASGAGPLNPRLACNRDQCLSGLQASETLDKSSNSRRGRGITASKWCVEESRGVRGGRRDKYEDG